MITTKPENFKLWLAALRSGQYPRTTGQLRHTSDSGMVAGFCGLGIACDVFMKTTGRGYWDGSFFCVRDDDHEEPMSEDTALIDPVMDWLGVDESDPFLETEDEWLNRCLDGTGETGRYSVIGDSDRGVPFPVIADKLERYLPQGETANG